MEINSQPYSFKPLVFKELDGTLNGTVTLRPEKRSGHRIVCDDSNFYSFGGYVRTESLGRVQDRLFEELWCFNFAEGSWKLLHTTGVAPKELASHAAALFGNFINVFGGTGADFGVSTSNKFFQCDLRTLKWQEVEATGDFPMPQYGQGLVLDQENRQIYVIGGTTGQSYTMDIHKLDIFNKSWELIHRNSGAVGEPKPRYRHEVAFDGTNMYIFGGGTNIKAYSLHNLPVFSLESRDWSILETKAAAVPQTTISVLEEDKRCDINGIPKKRKCHSAVQLGDDVYICGGLNDDNEVYDDIWRFNIPSREWHLLQQRLPIPLAFHAACVTSAGCMYTFGGVTNMARGVRTNKVFKIWLKIPKLQDICWEALTHYDDLVRTKTSKELMQFGVPYEYARRAHPAPPGGTPNPEVEAIWASDCLKDKNGVCCIQ